MLILNEPKGQTNENTLTPTGFLVLLVSDLDRGCLTHCVDSQVMIMANKLQKTHDEKGYDSDLMTNYHARRWQGEGQEILITEDRFGAHAMVNGEVICNQTPEYIAAWIWQKLKPKK